MNCEYSLLKLDILFSNLIEILIQTQKYGFSYID